MAESELGEEGVRHFLIVPRSAVEETQHRLKDLGFEDVEVDDRGMDVTAFQRGDIASLRPKVDEMEAKLTRLAESVGGEYDGLEWALPPESQALGRARDSTPRIEFSGGPPRDDVCYEMCFFCSQAVAEDDPDLIQVKFMASDDDRDENSWWMGCHISCAQKAAGPLTMFVDPRE